MMHPPFFSPKKSPQGLFSKSYPVYAQKNNPYIGLGGGFKDFLFSPLFGEDSHFDLYFSDGLKPPTR